MSTSDTPPFVVPPERAVPRLQIVLEPATDPDAAIDRVGGRPLAPSAASAWPVSAYGRRPMQFMFQLLGKAGGGRLELGDVAVLQVFADTQSEYYSEGEHAVVLHREPCTITMPTPEGVEMLEPQAMRFIPGHDDNILLEPWDEAREAECTAAHKHGFCSKVFGVPVAGRLDLPVEGADGSELRLIAQMNDIDDWFIWHVFANEDLSETKMEIVRG